MKPINGLYQIRGIRSLARMLGKLGIQSLALTRYRPPDWGFPGGPQTSYGVSMTKAEAFCKRVNDEKAKTKV